jgi:hypothetical protein
LFSITFPLRSCIFSSSKASTTCGARGTVLRPGTSAGFCLAGLPGRPGGSRIPSAHRRGKDVPAAWVVHMCRLSHRRRVVKKYAFRASVNNPLPGARAG